MAWMLVRKSSPIPRPRFRRCPERGLMRRIVDQDIDAAEVIDRLLDDFATVLCVMQVAAYKNRLAAFLLDEFLDLVRLFGLIEKRDQVGAPTRIVRALLARSMTY